MVRSPEGGSDRNELEAKQSEFLDGLLNAAPVLPVGEAGTIVDIIEWPEADEEDIPVYAWHGPRDLVVDVRRTRRDTKGPVIGLELCSSTPIATAHSTAREFDHRRVQARGIVQAFTTTEGIAQLRDSEGQLVPMAEALARSDDTRALMVAAIQRTLFEMTPDQHGDLDVLRERLRHNLTTQRFAYVKTGPPDDDGIESGWKLRYVYKDMGMNLRAALSALEVPSDEAREARKQLAKPPEGADLKTLQASARKKWDAGYVLASDYIDYQADVIAKLVANNEEFRISRFISMDILDPETIASHSVAKMPRSTQSMYLFSHAIAGLFNHWQHIQGDMRDELPVPDDSLTFIVSYDGWRPIEHRWLRMPGRLKREGGEAVDVLEDLYSKLKPGGQLVVFPWTESKSNWMERRELHRVKAELGRRISAGVNTRLFHRDTVEAWMTPGDVALSAVGNLLLGSAHSQTYEALMLEKLHESMLSRPSRVAGAAGRAAASN